MSKRNAPRIHVQKESNKKEFTPGVVGALLREALGIGNTEMPEWIFRMRKKGK